MAIGTVHDVARGLTLIEGHHPRQLWDDPDVPTVAAYRCGPRLYLLDTGVGPEQREALRHVAARVSGLEEVILLNSHGHMDHLGNNDVVAELGVPTVRHHIPRAARPALDFESFFLDVYKRGLPYFDYLEGLDLRAGSIGTLLRALGADPDLSADDVADLGARLSRYGVTPALGPFVPSLVVDILLNTYPPVFPSVPTMTDYEDLGDPELIRLGSTDWTGWTFTDEQGRPEVYALQSGGHSAGGLVFLLPEHRYLLMADETTAVPIWSDTDPRRAVTTARKALTLLDEGLVAGLCAGHRPMLPAVGDEARAVLRGIVDSDADFRADVDAALARRPEGACIDDLSRDLAAHARPDSTVALLLRLQFPVFSTFFKLTLLNHCLLEGLPTALDERGRTVFRAGVHGTVRRTA